MPTIEEINEVALELGKKMWPDCAQDQMAVQSRPLEAVEARLDSKLARIETKLELLVDRSEQAGAANREARDAANAAKDAADKAREAAYQTKWNILFAAIGIGAVMLSVAAIWSQAVEFGHSLVK